MTNQRRGRVANLKIIFGVTSFGAILGGISLFGVCPFLFMIVVDSVPDLDLKIHTIRLYLSHHTATVLYSSPFVVKRVFECCTAIGNVLSCGTGKFVNSLGLLMNAISET